MKNHFFVAYAGNKRKECEDLYNEIKDKLSNIKTIIEPFCGTAAFSYYLSLKHPKRFKYILNDNNKYLIQLYSIAKDEKKLEQLIILLDAKIKDLNKEKYDIIAKKDDLISWIVIHKIYNIRAGLFPYNRKIITSFNCLKDCPIIKFLRSEEIYFYNSDGIQIINKYKDNKENFIFLDPPYLISCNDFYADTKVNVYEYLYENKINNMKALIMLCLESNWIIKLLFNNQVKKEYSKIYQGSKKHTTHLIISNF
jgi:site-specific DNA-adenine methylase